MGANKFGVATQGISFATITRLLNEIYVATLRKYVATQTKNKPREKVMTEKREAMTEEATKTGGSIGTELSMSRLGDQFGPEVWRSTIQLMK